MKLKELFKVKKKVIIEKSPEEAHIEDLLEGMHPDFYPKLNNENLVSEQLEEEKEWLMSGKL